MNVETLVGVDAVEHQTFQIVAGVATVGVAHDYDGALVVGGKNHVDKLRHLDFAGFVVGGCSLSIHMQYVDVHLKSGGYTYCVVAESLGNQLVGAVFGYAVAFVP